MKESPNPLSIKQHSFNKSLPVALLPPQLIPRNTQFQSTSPPTQLTSPTTELLIPTNDRSCLKKQHRQPSPQSKSVKFNLAPCDTPNQKVTSTPALTILRRNSTPHPPIVTQAPILTPMPTTEKFPLYHINSFNDKLDIVNTQTNNDLLSSSIITGLPVNSCWEELVNWSQHSDNQLI